MGMGKELKDLKLKKVGSKSKSVNDSLYTDDNDYLSEKQLKKLNSKKNRRRFYTGFAVVSIIFVLCASLVVGSFVAWDMYGKEPTGLTLPEAVRLLSDLYKDGSDVVVNPYDPEKDLDAFYADLKRGLYLAEDCDITVDDIVSGVLSDLINNQNGENNGEESGENSDKTLASGGSLIMSGEEAPEIGDNDSVTGNKALDELLESLEFDFSVLEGQSQDTLEKEMLELSDKELAAVINEALCSLSSIDALKDVEEKYGVVIKNILSVEQVIIDQATVLEQQDVRVLVTIKINLRDAAKTALANNKEEILAQLGFELPDFAKNLVDAVPSLLPEKLYFTASIFPNQQTWSARVLINNMEEKQEAAVNRLLDKFLATEDEDGNKVPFLQNINAKVYDVIMKIDELLPVNFTPSGFETKPIEGVINMLGAENLTQGDFLALVRDVKLPTAEQLGVDGYTLEAQESAANKFIDEEFCSKYYFNNDPVDGQTDKFITASNLFSKINSFSEDEETLKRIEIRERIEVVDDYDDGEQFRLQANGDTLAALLNGYLKNQEYEIENMTPWVMDVECPESVYTGKVNSDFTLRITIELDLTSTIDSQLEGKESMKKLVKQLLPDSIYVFLDYSQTVDINGNVTSTAEVDINKKGNDLSKQHFETLMKLLKAVEKGKESGEEGGQTEDVTNMTFEELQEELNQKISDAFKDIENKLGKEIQFLQSTGNDNATVAILPNIFEVLANNEKLKYDPEIDGPMTVDEIEQFNKEHAITGEEMYMILSATYKYDPSQNYASNVRTEDGVSSFVSEIDNKYYIDVDRPEDDWSAANIQTMLSKIGEEYETRIRVKAAEGEHTTKTYLLTDESTDLNPFLNQYEFANIVNESGSLKNIMQIIPESRIEYIIIGNEGSGSSATPVIEMRIKGDISFDNLSGEDATAWEQNKKYSTLFPVDIDVIVRIQVLLDENGNISEYVPTVEINEIADEQLDKMLFFVRRFSGQTSMGEGEDKQDFSRKGLELTIKNKISSALNKMTAEGKVEMQFVEKSLEGEVTGGIEFSTIFELAVNNIYTEAGDEGNKPSGEAMRSTIKGLHEGMGNYAYSNKDYEPDISDNPEDGNSTFTISLIGTEVTVEAQFLDAYMGKKVNGDSFSNIIGGNPGDISFYQSYILPAYDNGSREELDYSNSVRAEYEFLGEDISTSVSYMLMTLRVETANLFGEDNAAQAKDNRLIPSEIYVSALIALESGNAQTQTTIFVNRMTAEESAIMNRILKKAGYDKMLFDEENGSTDELIAKIFETELVSYEYNYNVTIPGIGTTVSGTYPISITVNDVVSDSKVWYCSIDTVSRRDYIVAEAGRSFGDASDPRYGIAYLYYSETVDILDYIS